MDEQEFRCPESCEDTHTHEVLGSVMIAEREDDPHNHRFATVTGRALPRGTNDHVHRIAFRTDSYEGHFHEFSGTTLGASPVGDGHVHYLEETTSRCDGHRHDFKVVTLIDNPIGD